MKKNRANKEKELLNFSFDFELLEACPLCGSDVLIPNGKVEWLDMDFWYAVCGKCGLKFMNPRPTQKSYQDFYKNLFWEQKVANVGFHMPGQMWNTKRYKWDNEKAWSKKEGTKTVIEKHREMRVKIISDTLSGFITLDARTDILEVGAGFGVTLEELRKKYKSKVYAIEPSLEAQRAIKKVGTALIGSYAEDLGGLRNKKQKFDAIIFSHSLENTVYPLQIIKWAKQCLKKNGIIYVQCSNLLTFDQMNPYHPYIFSAHSLGLLAKKAGMKPLRAGERLHRMLTVVFKK
ncbi:MAG: class I SAM-dependent methyltransferase [Parcubacteria group bacterium]|nr:class I SAM-dependent methyltransferase [Parcubacteria group bacterium]